MRLAVIKNWSVPVCAGGLLALMPAGVIQAGEKLTRIQISDSSSPFVVSNLNRLDTGKSAFKQVEDDLFKNFQNPGGGDSMQPVMTPPFRPMNPAPLTPRQRELIDQRRNWAFVDPSDQLPKDEFEVILQGRKYGPDGREIIYLDPIQKYYESLNRRHGPGAAELDASPGAGRNQDFAGTNIFNPQNFMYGTNQPPGWSYGFSSNADTASPWAAGNPGQTGIPEVAAAEKARQLQHRLDFNRLLEGHTDPAPLTVNGASAPPGSPAGFVPNGLVDFTKPSGTAVPVEYRNSANPILGASIQLPTIQSHVSENPTLRALGMPQPEIKPPPPQSKPPTPPLIFTPPQRKFF